MANGTIVGETGTAGSAMLRTDYIDVAYIDEDGEAVEVSG